MPRMRTVGILGISGIIQYLTRNRLLVLSIEIKLPLIEKRQIVFLPKTLLMIVPGLLLLAVGFIQSNGARYADIQGTYHTYLGDNEIAVSQFDDLLAYTRMFIPKNERDRIG